MVCDRCIELRRDEQEAEEAGDLSRAVDCRVLIRRHPDHSDLDPRKTPPRWGEPQLRDAVPATAAVKGEGDSGVSP